MALAFSIGPTHSPNPEWLHAIRELPHRILDLLYLQRSRDFGCGRIVPSQGLRDCFTTAPCHDHMQVRLPYTLTLSAAVLLPRDINPAHHCDLAQACPLHLPLDPLR